MSNIGKQPILIPDGIELKMEGQTIYVKGKLGELNQTILTANAIRDMGLELIGIILNHISDERDSASITNRSVMEDIIKPPVILDILHEETEIVWPF